MTDRECHDCGELEDRCVCYQDRPELEPCQWCGDPLCDENCFDCGRLPAGLGGGCSKAGSEECDWDCPFNE